MKQFLFLELLKWFINALNTQIKGDIEEVKEFVRDFNKLFKDLEACRSNRDLERSFLKKYPKVILQFF